MRYTTTLILALVVLAAVVVIYFYHDDLTGKPPTPPKPAAAKPLIEDLSPDDITEAALQETGPDGALATKLAITGPAKDQWRLTEPVTGAADEYEVRRLLRGALESQYRNVIEPGAKGQPSLKDLKLDPPAYRLTLKGKGEKDAEPRTVTVDIGRTPVVGSGLYVRLDGKGNVFVLESADLYDRVRERLDTYRDRNLVDLVRDDVVRMQLAGEKGAVRLDRAEGDAERWILAEPRARADTDAVATLLRTALGLMAADFVSDSVDDFARYGLAEPRLTVTLVAKAADGEDAEKKTEDQPKKGEKEGEASEEKKPDAEPEKTVALAFGGWADLKRESVYVRIGDSKSVVAVEKGDFLKLDKGPADLRDKHVLGVDADRAVEVQVRLPATLAEGGQPIAYDLTKTDGHWYVKTEGREKMKADTAAVDALLKELGDLKVIYFAEGDDADAKAFKAAGSVRIQVEKETAAAGLEFGARGDDVPALVRNLREDWAGRINEKDLVHLKKDWLQMLDKQVLEFDPDRVTRLAIRGPDRTNVFEKKDGKWVMTGPVEADPRAAFVPDRLDDLMALKCEKVLAATKDFETWNLEHGELAVTVTLEAENETPAPAPAGETETPEKPQPADEKPEAEAETPAAENAPTEGEKPAAEKTEAEKPAGETPEAPAEKPEAPAAPAGPVEVTLILAHHKEAKVVGRVVGRDLVVQFPLTLLKDLASEPLPTDMTDLFSGDIDRLTVTAGDTRVTVTKVDDAWFRTDKAGRPETQVAKADVDTIVNAAVDLKAARWAAYDTTQQAAFGLDQPAVCIALTDTDKDKTATILLSGKPVDARVDALFDEQPLRYAFAEGGERIALVAGKNVQTVLDAAATLAPPKPETPKPDAPAKTEPAAGDAEKPDTPKPEPTPKPDAGAAKKPAKKPKAAPAPPKEPATEGNSPE